MADVIRACRAARIDRAQGQRPNRSCQPQTQHCDKATGRHPPHTTRAQRKHCHQRDDAHAKRRQYAPRQRTLRPVIGHEHAVSENRIDQRQRVSGQQRQRPGCQRQMQYGNAVAGHAERAESAGYANGTSWNEPGPRLAVASPAAAATTQMPHMIHFANRKRLKVAAKLKKIAEASGAVQSK